MRKILPLVLGLLAAGIVATILFRFISHTEEATIAAEREVENGEAATPRRGHDRRRPGEARAAPIGNAATEESAPSAVLPPDRSKTTVAEETATVHGRVHLPDGRPVAGATVVCGSSERLSAAQSANDYCTAYDQTKYSDMHIEGKGDRTARTDEDGRFTIAGVGLADRAGLVAWRDDVGIGMVKSFDLSKAPFDREIDVTIVPGLVVRGRVTNTEGDGVAKALISFMAPDESGGYRSTCGVVSAADGSYRTAPLPFRRMWISVEQADYAHTSKRIDESKSEIAEAVLDFTLTKRRTIKGRVVSAGGGSADLEHRIDGDLPADLPVVIATPADPATLSDEGRTYAEVARLPFGADSFTAKLEDDRTAWLNLWLGGERIGTTRVDPGATEAVIAIDWAAHPPKPKAKVIVVVTGPDGAPIANYRAALRLPVNGSVTSRLTMNETAKDRADGEVDFKRVLPGTGVLQVVAADFAPESIPVRIEAPETRVPVRLKPATAKCAVTVHDENGAPVNSALVYLALPDGRTPVGDKSRPDAAARKTNAGGSLLIDGIAPGEYLLVAAADTAAPAATMVAIKDGENSVDLTMTTGFKLEVRADGGPLTFRVTNSDDVVVHEDMLLGCERFGGGNIRLARGSYTIEVSSPGYVTTKKPFTLDKDTAIEVQMERARK